MEVRDRIILPLEVPGFANSGGANASDLLLHLLLFDTVILPTKGLVDFAHLAQSLGVADTVQLLETGLLKLRSEIDHIGTFDNEAGIVHPVHLFSNEPEEILSSHLERLRRIEGARHRDIKKLKLAVVAAWIRPEPEQISKDGAEAVADACRHALSRSPVFVRALDMALEKSGAKEHVSRAQLSVEDLGGSRLRIDIRGVSGNGIAAARAATRALAGLNRTFAEMRRDEAMYPLADDSRALLEAKLDFVVNAMAASERVPEFRRVVDAAGLPDFDEAVKDRRINIERLLHVRASDECRQLREMLRTSATLSDGEIREAVSGLKARLGGMLGSGPGKVFRVLVAAAIGLGGVPEGLAASAIDTFIVERLIRVPGAIAFLRDTYPSLFYPK